MADRPAPSLPSAMPSDANRDAWLLEVHRYLRDRVEPLLRTLAAHFDSDGRLVLTSSDGRQWVFQVNPDGTFSMIGDT